MSLHSCTVHEFPLPDRAYYAAAPAQWDEPMISKPRRRPAPSRVRRRRGRSPLPMLALAGVVLFLAGFLLGQVGAVGDIPSPPAASAGQQSSSLPVEAEDNSVKILTVPGAVRSTGEKKDAAASKDDWNLILINGDHPLPEDFSVPALTELRSGHAIDSRAYPALQAMMDDARAAGLQPLICSSYRTWDTQERLFEAEVRRWLARGYIGEDAEAQAAMWVARPGTSEHQLGLAVDIVDLSYQVLDEGQENTPVQQWLMAHCWEYGFILRYPTDQSGLTGIGYEPWHYRYVGAEAAREMAERGVCLEEYLSQ